jgi:hypothetical protein
MKGSPRVRVALLSPSLAGVGASEVAVRKIMSRLTKPSVIFRERVVPAYAAYLKDPLSERRANTLAEALNNTVEWTYLYLSEVDPARLNGATLASFRTGLLTEHRALHVMSDLADAAQHRELTFERKPERVVTLSTDAYYEKGGVSTLRALIRHSRLRQEKPSSSGASGLIDRGLAASPRWPRSAALLSFNNN